MGYEEGEERASVYSVMASWFTPSCLFLFVNLVIGTIAITSRFKRKRRLDSPDQLVRSTSLLDRVKSFGLGCYKYEPATAFVEENHNVVEPVHNHEPVPLDRTSSLSSLLDRVKSFKRQEDHSPEPDDPTGNQLTRVPSLLERFKSMKFKRSESVKAEEKDSQPELGSGSEYEILDGGDLMEESGEEEGVDAKADDFIKRFKQQLRLQRLDSILRYRNMLQRN